MASTFINRAYLFPGTAYTPPIRWNDPAQEINADDVPNLRLGPTGGVQQSESMSYDAAMSFGGTLQAPANNLTIEGVTAPYRNLYDHFAARDDFDTRRAGEDFKLFNGLGAYSVGVSYQTDGSGNITGHTIQPGNAELRTGTPAGATTFTDTAAIGEKLFKVPATPALFPEAEDSPLTPSIPRPVAQAGTDESARLNLLALQKGVLPFQQLSKLDLFTNPARSLAQEIPSAPTLPGLRRLQPPEIDTSVVGVSATIRPEDAAKIGVVQARLGVTASEETRNQLELLRNLAGSQQTHQLIHARERSMPALPFLPQDLPSAGSPFQGTPSGTFDMLGRAAQTDSQAPGSGNSGTMDFGRRDGDSSRHRQRRNAFSMTA